MFMVSPERRPPQACAVADFPVGNQYAANNQLMAKHERRMAIHRRLEGPRVILSILRRHDDDTRPTKASLSSIDQSISRH